MIRRVCRSAGGVGHRGLGNHRRNKIVFKTFRKERQGLDTERDRGPDTERDRGQTLRETGAGH